MGVKGIDRVIVWVQIPHSPQVRVYSAVVVFMDMIKGNKWFPIYSNAL
jgi:hypothetical protein